MAKQTFPGLKTGSKVLPKLIGTLMALALLAVIVRHPAEAATWAKSVVSLCGQAIDGLVTFFRSMGS